MRRYRRSCAGKKHRQRLLMPKQATTLLVTNPDGDGGDDLVLPYGL